MKNSVSSLQKNEYCWRLGDLVDGRCEGVTQSRAEQSFGPNEGNAEYLPGAKSGIRQTEDHVKLISKTPSPAHDINQHNKSFFKVCTCCTVNC